MLLTYSECIQKYESKYNLNKKVENGEIYQLKKEYIQIRNIQMENI